MTSTTTTTITITTTTSLLALLACAGAEGPAARSEAPAAPAVQPAPIAPAVEGPAPGGGPAAMQVPDNQESPAMESLSVQWSARREADALAVDYTVKNGGSAAIWLLDRTVLPKTDGVHPAYDRASVLAGERPDLARLVLAHVRPTPGNTVASEYTPGARRLEAGASAEGHLRVPLPLTAWNPFLEVDPLPGAPSSLRLEVGYLTDDPPEGVPAWDAWTPVVGDKDLKIPTLSYTVQRQRLLKGEVLPVP